MTKLLRADFVKRFGSDVRVEAKLEAVTDQPSVHVLFGPSGSGKSTILRCLAGLAQPEEGRIEYEGTAWSDAQTRDFLKPQARHIGFLFQQHALFPHLTVQENIAYGLRRGEVRKVDEYLSRFRLGDCASRYPHQISGGQQQRTALARTLVVKPRVLLLDEPLSSLDALLREELWGELREIFEEFGGPVFLVTHDRREAIALGTRLVVLKDGKIIQQGGMADVFSSPGNYDVARMVGVESILRGRILGIENGMSLVEIGGRQIMAMPTSERGSGVHVCIRGEDVVLRKVGDAGERSSVRNHWEGRVTQVEEAGALRRVHIDVGFLLTALVTRHALEELDLRSGQPVVAQVKATAIHLMPLPFQEIRHSE